MVLNFIKKSDKETKITMYLNAFVVFMVFKILAFYIFNKNKFKSEINISNLYIFFNPELFNKKIMKNKDTLKLYNNLFKLKKQVGGCAQYSGFCGGTNFESQCCDTNSKPNCTGGGKKTMKGGCAQYSGFCGGTNFESQCCDTNSKPNCTGGGKKTMKGSGTGALDQLYSNMKTPNIKQLEKYNKDIVKGLENSCAKGGGLGSYTQMAANSTETLTPRGILDGAFDIMNKLSSNEPTLKWATSFNDGKEMSEYIKKSTINYTDNIRDKLQIGGSCVEIINSENVKKLVNIILNEYKIKIHDTALNVLIDLINYMALIYEENLKIKISSLRKSELLVEIKNKKSKSKKDKGNDKKSKKDKGKDKGKDKKSKNKKIKSNNKGVKNKINKR